MTGTIFPVLALDRARVRWEDHLTVPTPVEDRGGRLYKREDAFAPLGPGGVNGAKLRQLVRMIADAHAAGAGGVLSAASVRSPQNPMAALVAAHYGLPCRIVLGGTKPATAVKHANVAIALRAGAEPTYVPVGYNPYLQKALRDLAATPRHAGWFRLPYGIGPDADADAATVERFHLLGAAQVRNLPPTTRTLVMTMGSAYSCASVLYGLARWPPAALERVVLLGIGPTRLHWLDDRLSLLERAGGVPIRSRYRRAYRHHPALALEHDARFGGHSAPVVLEHHDLHASGWCTYQDRRPFALDGIAFHPTYEGKALAYMAEQPDRFRWWWEPEQTSGPGTACFWIVGGEPSLAAMEPHL